MNRPVIFIRLENGTSQFQPEDVLVCEYRIDVLPEIKVTGVESSVMWTTTGKGEEDFGVHFFERRPRSTLVATQLRKSHRLSTVLPRSPLSYDGQIIQIRWSVRIRVFADGQQFSKDATFRLGSISPAESSSRGG